MRVILVILSPMLAQRRNEKRRICLLLYLLKHEYTFQEIRINIFKTKCISNKDILKCKKNVTEESFMLGNKTRTVSRKPLQMRFGDNKKWE